jgi:predicted nucleotide-binding protein
MTFSTSHHLPAETEWEPIKLPDFVNWNQKIEGGRVFIGHSSESRLWEELRDFLQYRGIPWDEFNRIPVAGKSIESRLEQMLFDAEFSLHVMTCDIQARDGKCYAKPNVTHEIGLFQKKLGYEKAVILLEDGCEVFSNINGRIYIRFPKRHIKPALQEVLHLLKERESSQIRR